MAVLALVLMAGSCNNESAAPGPTLGNLSDDEIVVTFADDVDEAEVTAFVQELQRDPARLRDIGVDAVDVEEDSLSGGARRVGISLRDGVPVERADDLVSELRRSPDVAEVAYSGR